MTLPKACLSLIISPACSRLLRCFTIDCENVEVKNGNGLASWAHKIWIEGRPWKEYLKCERGVGARDAGGAETYRANEEHIGLHKVGSETHE